MKASRASTDGAITVIDSDTTGGAPRHVHSHEDECFYVLDGIDHGRVRRRRVGAAGGRRSCSFRSGLPHAWDVIGERARLLIITAPPGSRSSFASCTRRTSSPPEVARRHGIEFL